MLPLKTLPDVSCTQHQLPWGEVIYSTGPSWDEGKLPAFFYFSLAGDESLCLPPFNSPVAALKGSPLRIFSLTLPGHGEGRDPHKGIAYWAAEMKAGRQPLTDFFDQVLRVIDHLIEQQIIDSEHIATGGLSRGGLVATHVAARDSRIKAVCGFAPWTSPAFSNEFRTQVSQADVQALSLTNLIDQLVHTSIRFYVGNRDIAVGTHIVFNFIYALAERAYQARVRSPKAELIITPAIGHRGHGTPTSSFVEGAAWLREQLLDE